VELKVMLEVLLLVEQEAMEVSQELGQVVMASLLVE
jgi:hypothetical protein